MMRYDDEPVPEEQTNNSNLGDPQSFWFDEGLYQEWVMFLQQIWSKVEYL